MGRRHGPGDAGAADEREPGPAIELEVVRDFVEEQPAGERGRGGPLGRARITAVMALAAVAAAVALAVTVSVVLVDRSDREDATSPSGGTAGEPSTVAATVTSSAPVRPVDPASVLGGLTMPEFEGITVPTLPAPGTASTDIGGRPALLEAVRRLGADVPRRSTTTVSLGYGGFRTTATILRDPSSDRYLLTVETDVGSSTVIIDGRTEVAYVAGADGRWSEVDIGGVAEALGLRDAGELYRRLLSGPVRPDTIALADVAVPGSGELDAGRPDGIFRVALPGEAVPLWRVHHLVSSSEFDPSGLPAALVYDVYVEDEITAVIGLSELDGVPQVVDHRIEKLAERVAITLPE